MYLLLFVAVVGQCLSEVIFPCYDVCLHDDVVYTCTGKEANLITWTVPNSKSGALLQVYIYQLTDTNGLFTAQFVSYQNNNIISTLSFTATVSLHNKQVKCKARGNTKTCKITTIGEPTAPLNFRIIATTHYTVVVSWISPVTGSQCINHYIVTVVSETHNNVTSVNTTNNATSLFVYGLAKAHNYSFTVKAIDHAGRIGSNSQKIYLVFDVPESVVNITYSVELLTTVSIQWLPPAFSLKPPITHYHIYHNLTTSDGSIIHDITNNITHLIVTGLSYGNNYSVTVIAENVVGQGPGVTIDVVVFMMQSSADTSVVLTSSTSLSSIFWLPSYEEIKASSVDSTLTYGCMTIDDAVSSEQESAIESYSSANVISNLNESHSLQYSCHLCTGSTFQKFPECDCMLLSFFIAVPITAFFTAVITALITSGMFCICIKRRKKLTNSFAQEPAIIYDLPHSHQQIIELEMNTAYEQVHIK